MYLDSIAFKAMESGLQAMSMKKEIHTQNIANLDTPDYKYKSVSFESVLNDVKKDDGTVSYDFDAKVTEHDSTDVLVDGNNVSIDSEGVELYSTYIQSSAIIQKMNSAIGDLRYVLTNSNFK